MNLVKKAKEQLVKPRVFIPIGMAVVIVIFITMYKFYEK